MATNNAVNVPLSGSTGTGAFVGNISPTFVTTNINVGTGTSLAFNPLTSGIIGTPTNNNASAGFVGEVMTVNVTTPGVSVTSNTQTNIMTLTLTPGDWDVKSNFLAVCTAAVLSTAHAGISTTSATLPNQSLQAAYDGTAATSTLGLAVPYQRFNVTTNTQIWLVGFCIFGSGTTTIAGNLTARRRR